MMSSRASPQRRLGTSGFPRTTGTARLHAMSNRLSCVLLLLAWSAVSASSAEFQAGFATADITPPYGRRRAGGFSEVVRTGVGDPLLAKAMVLRRASTTVALVGNDLCSVPRELTDRARGRPVPDRHSVANIVITATHTHGGPEYYGPLAGLPPRPRLGEHGAETRTSRLITTACW